MQKKFCHHCGKQVELCAKFCSSCGTSLTSLSSTPPPATPAPSQFTPFSAARDDDDDDSYIDKITHLDIRQNELHVEIIKDPTIKETVGSVMSQSISPDKLEKNDRQAPIANVEEFKKNFQQEAGTLRNEKPK